MTCEDCPAPCCRKLRIEVTFPSATESEFAEALRFIENFGVLVENINTEKRSAWMRVNNPCRHLTADHKCDDYEARPLLCREYRCPGLIEDL